MTEKEEVKELLENYKKLVKPTREAFFASVAMSLAAQTIAEREAARRVLREEESCPCPAA
jgi:hypothetical protein